MGYLCLFDELCLTIEALNFILIKLTIIYIMSTEILRLEVREK